MNADLRAVVLLAALVAFVVAIAVTPRDRLGTALAWVAFGLALWGLTWFWDAAKVAGWW